MIRVRLIPIGATVALAIGAVTCASASAAKEFSVENVAVAGSQFYRGMTVVPNGVGFLEATLSGTRVGIVCNVIQYDGFFEKEGKQKGTNTFSGCYMVEISLRTFKLTNCGVEPFTIKFTGKLTEKAEIEQAPQEEKERFGKVKITVCGVKGTYEVKGKEFCSIPWSEVESPVHGWVCGSTGGDIKTVKEGEMATSEAKLIYATTIMTPNATMNAFLSWGIK